MSDFPPAGIIEDGKFRTESQKDPARRHETEGGYVITRPRYTRTPRRMWTTGFTDITDAQRQALITFWEGRKGTADSFTWTDPVTSVEYTVRFSTQLTFVRTSKGPRHHWDTEEITLEEV